MFSGIVEEQAIVENVIDSMPFTLRVRSSLNHSYTKIGDSIALNGACLTVVKLENNLLDFELSPETLSRTNLGNCKAGSLLNLERSLIIGERLHGHFVSGHVDAQVELLSSSDKAGSKELEFSLPDRLKKFVVEKGSVSVDGVSLTVASVSDRTFHVSVIPHTLKNTLFGRMAIGDKANFEIDMLARYVLEGRP